MLYCFRERELLLNINEMLAGFRMFPSYMRVGGLREDLPRGFHDAVRAFLDRFAAEARRVRRPADEERDLPEADAGRRRDLEGRCGRLRPGRADRARRRRRLRRPQVRFRISATRPTTSTVPTQTDGDVYARYLVRVAEMRESVKICRQALERITPTGVVRGRRSAHHAAAQGSRLHRDGSADSALPDLLAGLHRAGRRGLRAGRRAARRARASTSCRTAPTGRGASSRGAPSLLACQALEQMIVGGLIADVDRRDRID